MHLLRWTKIFRQKNSLQNARNTHYTEDGKMSKNRVIIKLLHTYTQYANFLGHISSFIISVLWYENANFDSICSVTWEIKHRNKMWFSLSFVLRNCRCNHLANKIITGVGSGVDMNNKNSFSDFFIKMFNFVHVFA